MTALYKVRQELQQIEWMQEDLLRSNEENSNLALPQYLHDTLEGLTGEIEMQLVDIGAMIKNYEMDLCNMDSYIYTMKKKRDALSFFVDELKSYVTKKMVQHNFKKINNIEFDLSLRKSTSVKVTDIELLSERYIKTKVTRDINKVLIKEDIKAGTFVGEGAKLETNENLVIR